VSEDGLATGELKVSGEEVPGYIIMGSPGADLLATRGFSHAPAFAVAHDRQPPATSPMRLVPYYAAL
jgi:hypothetical protein